MGVPFKGRFFLSFLVFKKKEISYKHLLRKRVWAESTNRLQIITLSVGTTNRATELAQTLSKQALIISNRRISVASGGEKLSNLATRDYAAPHALANHAPRVVWWLWSTFRSPWNIDTNMLFVVSTLLAKPLKGVLLRSIFKILVAIWLSISY